MCGIAGAAWSQNGQPLDHQVVQQMTAVLSHRGPDDDGIHIAGNHQRSESSGAALGFRRLSIIDLAGGHQPLSNEDESIWIVFNGEIYNYRELRSDLKTKGHQFRTESDTETIVHLYEDYGADCVLHLRGMFAFAIWDGNQQRLLLARDRLGQKPLVYHEQQDRLLFASELKAILQVPGVKREINPRALDQYLAYQYVPHPDSILKGFRKLPPAHRAIYTNGTLQVERYWNPPYCLEELPATEQQQIAVENQRLDWTTERWRQELRETLTESVRLRMRSDVPLGAFLSGGIDSTIIAGLMQQLSEQPIHTFSIGFPVKKFDETSYARQAAERIGSQHHESIVQPSALEILPTLIWHYDEPFSDSSAIPTMCLSKMTRDFVTVALSGDGADELFSGYDRYHAVQLSGQFDRLPAPIRNMFGWSLWQKLPASIEQKSLRRRIKRFLAALSQSPERRYLRWIGIFDEESRRKLYTDEFAEQLGDFDACQFLLDAYADCGSRDFVTQTSCVDVKTYLPCDILKKVDIASMAYSLECRSPFLDHRVAELAAQMPIELKRRGKWGKRILVETFSDILPHAIQTRSKMGFGVPIDHWFRGELKPLLYETLLDDSTVSRGYFRKEAIEELIEQHVSRQWDHSYRLWSLLCFEEWHRMFLDPAEPPSSPPN